MAPAAVLTVLVAALAVGAGAKPPASPGSGPSSNSSRQQLKGTKPAWTAAAPQSGSVSASQRESAKVWLAPRDAAQLASLAQAVSDPSSSQFRHFLTHDQYASQFAPTSDQISAVTAWLKQAKLSVDAVGPDNHYVAVSGTAAAMTAAFGAGLGLYSVNGSNQQAPTSDLSVPSSVAGVVLGVTGLTTFGHRVHTDLSPQAGFVNAQPCSSYYGEQKAQSLPKFDNKVLPYSPCGYTPSQFRGAYGVAGSGSTGAGQTVAITDAFDSPTLQSDANTYASRHGDPEFAPGQFTDSSVAESTPLADACGGNSWYGEQTLDVEAVHGMATGANVGYYGAASCFDDDLLAALTRVVQDDKASIVTNSWGEPTFVVIGGQLFVTIDDSIVLPYESVFEQGAVQGIGFYFSSGDFGDELATSGFKHPDWPAEDPLVTAVGGTSLAIGNGNTRKFETGWGTSQWDFSGDGSSWVQSQPFKYGAGGGYSQLAQPDDPFFGGSLVAQGEPAYQQGIVPEGEDVCPTGPNDLGSGNGNGCRGVPDVAMDGDPTTGMLIGETQHFSLPTAFGAPGDHYGEYRVGGTSLASPLFAGVQAVAQQGAGQRLGFANPLIYGLKGSSNGASSFYDSNATQPDPGNVRSDYANSQNAGGGVTYSVRTFDQDASLNTAKGWDTVTGVGTVTGRYIARAAGT